MMDLTLEQLRTYAQQTKTPSITIYLPTHLIGPDTQQNPIRLRNVVRHVEHQLAEQGMKPPAIAELLAPVQDLLLDTQFWQGRHETLVLLVAPDEFHSHWLPFTTEEEVIIGTAFYLKPMLPLFTGDGRYLILAVSQNDVRLFEATRRSIMPLLLPEDAPTSLAEALKYDDEEKQLQSHSTASGSGMIFHGQGVGAEGQKVKIERFFQQLDSALAPVLRQFSIPLVLAGADYLLPIYRRVSEYKHILAEGIAGNPERLRPDELQAKAWPLVEPLFRKDVAAVLARYQQWKATPKVVDGVEAIVAAAVQGRVAQLVLAADVPVWGTLDAATGLVTSYQVGAAEAGGVALLDYAAIQTLTHGGEVYALPQRELTVSAPGVAILRY